jgi:hypothetical protein
LKLVVQSLNLWAVDGFNSSLEAMDSGKDLVKSYRSGYEPIYSNQSCGSGSGVDPDSVTLWIRICIGNPDPGARKLRDFSGKMHLVIFKKIYH